MAKKVTGVVKLQIPAGAANPAPPVGPALGSAGVNIMQFCKEFNAKTAKDSGLVIPVIITVYQDRSFSLQFKSPPASVLLKKEAGLAKGSGVPNKNKVGKVTKAQLLKIVEMKKADLNTDDPEQAIKMIAGTARNMGIEVVTLEEAVKFVKDNAGAKFDETVDVYFHLGKELTKGDTAVRGTVKLPNGSGKTVKVCVFAGGDAAEPRRQQAPITSAWPISSRRSRKRAGAISTSRSRRSKP